MHVLTALSSFGTLYQWRNKITVERLVRMTQYVFLTASSVKTNLKEATEKCALHTLAFYNLSYRNVEGGSAKCTHNIEKGPGEDSLGNSLNVVLRQRNCE